MTKKTEKTEIKMKPLRCLIGLHKWHEHDVYCPAYVHPSVHGCGTIFKTMDRVCLLCGNENRKASRLYERDARKAARGVEAERRLREMKERS